MIYRENKLQECHLEERNTVSKKRQLLNLSRLNLDSHPQVVELRKGKWPPKFDNLYPTLRFNPSYLPSLKLSPVSTRLLSPTIFNLRIPRSYPLWYITVFTLPYASPLYSPFISTMNVDYSTYKYTIISPMHRNERGCLIIPLGKVFLIYLHYEWCCKWSKNRSKNDYI